VAHEINNPLGFVTSNLETLDRYTGRLCEMLRLYRAPVDAGEAQARWKELKLDFIMHDAGTLIQQSLDGARRAAKIVADLRGFSHIDDGAVSTVDVNREIERTLSVLKHEMGPDVTVELDLRPLPPITANPALVCQVFYNLMKNALQTRKEGLHIRISTTCSSEGVKVRIADNGPGIPEDIRGRIFEPFFTTRDVGQGTGMGLTTVYEIMREHGGSIQVESVPGKSAVFTAVFPAKEKGHV
jgi:signal transduction histidine kinase